jgi:hypothetical protein
VDLPPSRQPPNGRLPAPRPGQRVRAIPLQAEILPGGGIRISTPLARGWAGHARTAVELANTLAHAFVEVEVAGYAAAHGENYDQDRLTEQVNDDPLAGAKMTRRRGPVQRRAAHPPEMWSMNDDGSWRSPAGRRYPADSQHVQRVIAKLEAKGHRVDSPKGSGVG